LKELDGWLMYSGFFIILIPYIFLLSIYIAVKILDFWTEKYVGLPSIFCEKLYDFFFELETSPFQINVFLTVRPIVQMNLETNSVLFTFEVLNILFLGKLSIWMLDLVFVPFYYDLCSVVPICFNSSRSPIMYCE
jgi:hypothetical protein